MPFLKYLNELTINGRPVNDDDELEDDYTADTGEDEGGDQPNTLDLNTDDDTGDEPADDAEGGEDAGGDDAGGEEETPDEEDEDVDTDYTAQAQAEEDDEGEEDAEGDDTGEGNNLDLNPDDEGEGDGEEGTDELDDNSTDTSDTGSSLEEKIKQTESEIFNTLSDTEKAIKNKELINDYINLRSTIKLFLEKIRTVVVTETNEQIINFVEYNLIDLENIITDYIIERYNTKSYIENFVFYQQVILTLTQLKDLISKVKVEEESQK